MWKHSMCINTTTCDIFLTRKEWEIIWEHDDHEQLSWNDNLTAMEIYMRLNG